MKARKLAPLGLLFLQVQRLAAAAYAQALGVPAHILSDEVEGESREVGKVHAALARAVARTSDPWMLVGLSLFLGGALGNLVDRVFRAPGPLRGAVVDFVKVGPWPLFNVADSAITIGAIIIIVRVVFDGRGRDAAVAPADAGTGEIGRAHV